MLDKKRIGIKFRTVTERRGTFYAFFYIIWFVMRDLLNDALIYFIHNKASYGSKRILFVESPQQGYGDLFFQTALFEYWNKAGFEVEALVSKNHRVILENNPYVKRIYNWGFLNFIKIPVQRYLIIGLGRDTLRGCLLLLLSFRSERLVLDKDVVIWKRLFSDNSDTIAWQKIVEHYMKIDCHRTVPRLFLSGIDVQRPNERRIAVVAGVEDRTKRFGAIQDMVSSIKERMVLVGKGKEIENVPSNAVDLVNKLSYADTLREISKCNVVIGPEGSLLQISASMGLTTIVIDPEGRFAKNCHPKFLESTTVIKSGNASEVINQILEHL